MSALYTMCANYSRNEPRAAHSLHQRTDDSSHSMTHSADPAIRPLALPGERKPKYPQQCPWRARGPSGASVLKAHSQCAAAGSVHSQEVPLHRQ
eukprot:5921555-Prymnesium_polylepis.1